MDDKRMIKLLCLRKNGRRETTVLHDHSLCEARRAAKGILEAKDSPYALVNICEGDDYMETLQNPTATTQFGTNEVLLVEDNAGDALLVGQAIAECMTSVHLRVARDGEQALQMLGDTDFKPDLVILDLNIPKVSGFTVLASYPLKKVPMVVFTASENEADANRAMMLGAFECVHKPMDLEDYKTAVCGMVHKWLPREEGGVSSS